jgi:hypothetical protein
MHLITMHEAMREEKRERHSRRGRRREDAMSADQLGRRAQNHNKFETQRTKINVAPYCTIHEMHDPLCDALDRSDPFLLFRGRTVFAGAVFDGTCMYSKVQSTRQFCNYSDLQQYSDAETVFFNCGFYFAPIVL